MNDAKSLRRVIASIGPDGRSRVISDAPSPHVKSPSAGVDFAEIWGTPSPPPRGAPFVDVAAAMPDAVAPTVQNETYCRIAVIQPDPPDIDHAALMHATKTVDYCFVLSGELVCLFEEGEVTLHPGDCLVQRGNLHAWANRGSSPAVFACVQIAALDHGTLSGPWEANFGR